MKKVSVIVPVYNVERYINKCVKSVLNQTYTNIEVLLIDDGATDLSGKICDTFGQNDDRVIVIHQTNSGAAAAKNKGLSLATGEYIAFVDSDDWVEPNWLEKTVGILQSTKADIVEYNYYKEFVDGRQLGNLDFTCCFFSAEQYLSQYLSNWTCSLFWNKVFQRNVVQDIFFRNERRCIDDEFFTYKVVSKAKLIVRIEDNLYHYRQRKNSAVSSEKHYKQITDDAMELRPERIVWIEKYQPCVSAIFIEKDIDFLLYWAKSREFDDILYHKFSRVRKFYLKRIFKIKMSVKNFFLILAFVKCKPNQKIKEQTAYEESDRFFE